MMKLNGDDITTRLASSLRSAAQSVGDIFSKFKSATAQGGAGVPTIRQAEDAIRHLIPKCGCQHYPDLKPEQPIWREGMPRPQPVPLPWRPDEEPPPIMRQPVWREPLQPCPYDRASSL